MSEEHLKTYKSLTHGVYLNNNGVDSITSTNMACASLTHVLCSRLEHKACVKQIIRSWVYCKRMIPNNKGRSKRNHLVKKKVVAHRGQLHCCPVMEGVNHDDSIGGDVVAMVLNVLMAGDTYSLAASLLSGLPRRCSISCIVLLVLIKATSGARTTQQTIL
jgi:hypothetical protein